METGALEKDINKINTLTCNYSDDELIFKELCVKSHLLKTQLRKMLQVKEDLSNLSNNNEMLSKRLLGIKTDYEIYKLKLHKTLHNLKLSTDKQKIISKKKLEELNLKQKGFEEYYKVSPYQLKLDELIETNRILEEEWRNKTELFNLTKKQYSELKSVIMETFRKKVCEFSDIVLRLEAFK